MLTLDTPVSALNKIGPKYKTLLEKLEINTLEDLLYHFPFRYEDYSEIKPINGLEEGRVTTIKAKLNKIDNIFTRNGKRLSKATVEDYSGSVDLIWFNQHYLKKTLKVGGSYFFSGKVQTFNGKLCLVSPEIEDETENPINTGRLVSVYPETYGISSKWLRTRINDVLARENMLSEFLPDNLLKSRDLKNFKWSIKQIHFPDGKAEIEIARKRLAFEELFLELLKVERRKVEWTKLLKGIKMSNSADNLAGLREFVQQLPFELTRDQKTAVDGIVSDLLQGHPMNRLLEGDVGTGKTVVAVISAYFTHLNGLKTVYMAPTEILAQQHYQTFINLLEKYKINVLLLTSESKSKKTNKSDAADIIIGTHAVLYNSEYKNTGLVVIDEQHKFGVEQRGKLIDITKDNKDKAVPHLLTMTATPIPRTLALTLYGDLAISVLKTRPNIKRKVSTRVVPENQRELAYKWVKNKNEQTFIVCPLIEESESGMLENVKAAEAEYNSLKKGVFKDLSVGLLHGRMKSKEKEEIVEKFRKGEVKVLVSTPVIEVGIDIPEATVIVIESAERYGLASLHQLRGRVGRTDKEGFCLVFMSTGSKSAYSRLKKLESIDDGLELAELDMKIRGKGDIFGTMQHGFKKFKIASLDDLEMLENAKLEAQKYYYELDSYPFLAEKLESRSGKYVKNN